jgi:hypothetical protein
MDTGSDQTQTPDGNDPEVCTRCAVRGCDGFECRPKPEPWSKKTKRGPKPKTKRKGTAGRHWSWGHLNVFQPVHKWTIRGRLIRPTLRRTIPGCIYYAMKRIARGSDRLVHRAALEDGLGELTIQPTFPRVQAELRLLAQLGVIKRTKHPKTKKRRRP